MKIIQRYFTVNLVWPSMLALFVLVALFTFFALIDQLEETGTGSYGVPQAVIYVLLITPRLAYELFPIAAVTGSMAALGMMAKHSELAVIRTSGVSKLDLTFVLLRSGLVLVAIAIIIGELLVPVCEEKAQQMRSLALTDQIALKTKYGFWARDGNSYINIRKILTGRHVEQIYIYEFDNSDELRSSTYAKRGKYVDGKWLLEDIKQTVIGEDQVSSRQLKLAKWDSLLNPEMVNLLIVKPEYLTFWELKNYIGFLEQNGQDAARYKQAFWTKLIRPVSILVMIILAVPLVRGTPGGAATGQRVAVGTLIGIVFHITNQIAGHMGVVYAIPPAISVTLPTIILGLITLLMLRNHVT